jgi:hypothetical protein
MPSYARFNPEIHTATLFLELNLHAKHRIPTAISFLEHDRYHLKKQSSCPCSNPEIHTSISFLERNRYDKHRIPTEASFLEGDRYPLKKSRQRFVSLCRIVKPGKGRPGTGEVMERAAVFPLPLRE